MTFDTEISLSIHFHVDVDKVHPYPEWFLKFLNTAFLIFLITKSLILTSIQQEVATVRWFSDHVLGFNVPTEACHLFDCFVICFLHQEFFYFFGTKSVFLYSIRIRESAQL